jgi:hypothetical protein
VTPEAELIEAANDLAFLVEGLAMINGHPVLIGDATGGSRPAGQSSTISKAEIAKLAHAGGDKHHQDIAEKVENDLAAALGMTKSPDNKPFDLTGKKYCVEVKTLVSNTNDKITMSKEAIARKDAAVKESGLKPFTVVVDARGAARTYHIRAGYGSFRLGSMTKVGVSGLRGFMSASV